MDRRDQIVRAAATLAASDGWEAVTVRRLSSSLGFSQPILYRAFPGGRAEIVAAVASHGFDRLAEHLPRHPDRASLADAYLSFARDEPALYRAMFELDSGSYGTPDAPAAARTVFERVTPAFPGEDAEARAEAFWCALHGIATFERDGRVRPDLAAARLQAVLAGLT